MEGLGSTDQEMRDSFCLSILSTWIEQGYYNHQQLQFIIEQLIKNLNEGIGEESGLRVLLRSFSVLILSSIIQYDANERFLKLKEIHHIMDAALEYLEKERDWRGFIENHGWSDSLNHTMFILQGLGDHPATGKTELNHLLSAITNRIISPPPNRFVSTEEFQMAEVVISVLNRDVLSLHELKEWLHTLDGTEICRSFVQGEEQDRYHNARDFLVALHLLLSHKDVLSIPKEELLTEIHIVLKSYIGWIL